MRSKLYCSKNILSQYETNDIDCDGPYGNGVDEKCIGCCSNAFTNINEVTSAIGYLVLKYLEIN